jgi:DNA-binding transcriptional LysR family regulator
LISDGVDCVIRGGVLADSSLVARRIADLEYVTCASAAYLKAHGTPAHPKDLEHGHHLVGYFSSLTGRPFPLIFEKAQGEITIATEYPANRHLSAKLRVFADWVVEAFAARLGTTKFSGDKSLKR